MLHKRVDARARKGHYIAMSNRPSTIDALSKAVRDARQKQALSIADLARRADVSRRLVGEFERGLRPNVSFETALRLIEQLHLPISIAGIEPGRNQEEARAERAALRRQTWTGKKTTLVGPSAPAVPQSHVTALSAVARASRLAVALQVAHGQAQKKGKASRKFAKTKGK